MTIPLRERRKQALQDEIMVAARNLVASKGYAAMSMDELASQVGISKPTLYTYFKNKDELVAEAATHDMRAMLELLSSMNSDHSPMERIRFILREIVERHKDMYALGIGPWPEIFQVLLRNPASHTCMQAIIQQTTMLVHQAMEQGDIDPQLDPDGVVHALYGLASTLAKSQAAGLTLRDPTRVAETLITVFERGVRPA